MRSTIPTCTELRDSLGFLRSAGLIEKNDGAYRRTAAGRSLISSANKPSDASLLDTWPDVESEISKIKPFGYKPDDLSETQFHESFAAYKAWFKQEHGKLVTRK